MSKKHFNTKGIYLGSLVNESTGRKNALYIKKPTWDCNWYWGLGYCQGLGYSHTHFDSLFKNCTQFIEMMEQGNVPFDRNELYKIYEYMKTLYTLKQYAEMLHWGGSHITVNDVIDRNDKHNVKEYLRINQDLIPATWNSLVDILLEEEDRAKYYIVAR